MFNKDKQEVLFTEKSLYVMLSLHGKAESVLQPLDLLEIVFVM